MKRFVCVAMLGVCGSVFGQTAAAPPTMAVLLGPALRQVGQSVGGLQPERWKLSGDLKQQTRSDIGSIERDLGGTLPGLMEAADRAPGSVVAGLPVAGNVDALYDVLLRVSERASLSAPGDQTAAAGSALQQLADARKELNIRLQADAAAAERQMGQMRAELKTQTDASAAARQQVTSLQAQVAACTPAKPAPKRRVAAKKPVAKPASK